jgi:hypothetical protein
VRAHLLQPAGWLFPWLATDLLAVRTYFKERAAPLSALRLTAEARRSRPVEGNVRCRRSVDATSTSGSRILRRQGTVATASSSVTCPTTRKEPDESSDRRLSRRRTEGRTDLGDERASERSVGQLPASGRPQRLPAPSRSSRRLREVRNSSVGAVDLYRHKDPPQRSSRPPIDGTA